MAKINWFFYINQNGAWSPRLHTLTDPTTVGTKESRSLYSPIYKVPADMSLRDCEAKHPAPPAPVRVEKIPLVYRSE